MNLFNHSFKVLSLVLFLSIILFAKQSEVIILERHIIFSNNDAEEHIDGIMDLSSSDLEMCWEDDVQNVGLRFSDIKIPKGAKIVDAWIQFETDEINSTKTQLFIYVEDNVNPLPFFNTPLNITSRKKYSQNIIWKPKPWLKESERNYKQRTPDLTSLVQHIVNKKAWQSGNSILFIIQGAGKRVAKAFTDNTKEAILATPMLHISYSIDSNINNTTITPPHKKIKKEHSPYQKSIRISEIMSLNANINYDPDYKEFSDWIELHNETNQTIDLSGFWLSDNPKVPKKWSFPSSTKLKPKGYLIVWADKKDNNNQALHTSFSLNSSKGEIILSDKKTKQIDILRYPKQKSNISYGCNGSDCGYMLPTPNSINQPIHKKAKRTKKPKFKKSSGFYTLAVTVSLQAEKGTDIFFTLDGSTPTPKSKRFIKPFKIYKTTTVKAIAIKKGLFPSPVTMHTYLIDENTTLPVVSIGIDRSFLYGTKIGIAKHYNKHWIRSASIEYFKNKKRQFGANIGLKISGNHTRDYPQKSFALFFRKRFGSKELHYPLFEQKPWLNIYKSFTLRNSGTYWGHSMFSECISHKIVMNNMDIDAQSCQPAIVFINGIYEGIYNIRERMNEAYLHTNHKVKGKIDLIEHDEDYDTVKSGKIDKWYNLIDYVRNSNLTDKNTFMKVSAQIDIDELINHAITESFFGNSSIQHNVKRWRLQKHTGKWRTLLFDLDRGFDMPTDKVLGYLLDQNPTNILFERLMQNREFRVRFISRYFTHLNTTFRPERIDRFITDAKDKIESEIKRHFKKWSIDYNGEKVSLKTWEKDVEALYNFSHHRGNIVRKKLQQTFNLKGNPTLKLTTEKGLRLFVDGVEISDSYRGEYFKGAKITIQAVTKSQCRFDRWSDGNQNATREINLINDLNLSASIKCNRKLSD